MVAFSHGRSIFSNFSEKGSKTENADNFTIFISEKFTFYKIALCLPFVSICNYNKIILATSIVYHSLMSHLVEVCANTNFSITARYIRKRKVPLWHYIYLSLYEIVLLFMGVLSIRHTFQWIMYKNHFIIKILLLLWSCWKSTAVISHVS